MTVVNDNTSHRPQRDPRVILGSLDGRKFIRPNQLGIGVLSGKADMSTLCLHLYDSDGVFRGCYLPDQLSFVGMARYEKAIRIL